MITKERRKPGKARSSRVNDTHSAEGYSRVKARGRFYVFCRVFLPRTRKRRHPSTWLLRNHHARSLNIGLPVLNYLDRCISFEGDVGGERGCTGVSPPIL